MNTKSKITLSAAFCVAGGIAAVAWAQQSSLSGKSPMAGILLKDKAPELLEPDEAFKSRVSVVGPNKLAIDVTPAGGYYVYKDKIRVTIKNAGGASLGAVHLPPAETKVDQTFGKTEVYHQTVKVGVDLVRVPTSKKVTVVTTYQGCNEKIGVCYSPIEKSVDVVLP
ncbi:protein-disulfide reductase DsbD N-terminal domain-containing protein [Massilia putida]|uniref:protein-disulfide reductase DsbD N-terminal domain-containing protein n=1 Tax=Massilia putida TaxID=1141883 RepID=UPI0009528131|nr:protein-disulfide reductase DsbD N-terminal domain-containing protein [Massilia putida]